MMREHSIKGEEPGVPKATAYCLTWSYRHEIYELVSSHHAQVLPLSPGSDAWFAWLTTISSFTFRGQHGRLTVRQEQRQHGGAYWYAYHRVGEKMTKRYLGKTSEVTLARLEQVAEELGAAVDGAGNNLREGASLPKSFPTDALPVFSPQVEARETTRRGRQRAWSQRPHEQLLTTKFHPPRPRSRLIARTHLTSRLQQGMEHGLTLLSAPAGFGKTTLLAQWLAEISMPVAWLSLDPEDNDPVRFLTYFTAALQARLPQLGVTRFRLLEVAPSTPLESVFMVLTTDLVSRPTTDFALVLDDYHVITLPAIHHALTFLVEHLPPQMHLVLASRSDPPFPLARMRARGQLVEVRTDTLRLDETEVGTFLRVVSGLDLPSEAIVALERRTEGWIAGLQLAALSLQGRTDIPAFLAAFTGSHRFVLDYLSEEVLARQSASIQSFLLRTSILDRLCGSLCEAVTGEVGGQAMLEALERANLFVVPLDEERRWYRYHHLFAELLKSRLEQAEPALLPDLHRRASAWYERQGLLLEAVQHALSARDVELAARFMEQVAPLLMAQGRPRPLLDWLTALPDSLVRARPHLCVWYAAALHVINQVEEAEARVQDAQRALSADTSPEEVAVIQGGSANIRANIARYSGDLPRYLTLAQQGLDVWPETAIPATRAVLVMQVAHTFLVSGEMTPVAEQQVRAAVTLTAASGYRLIYFRSLTLLARLHLLQGRLRAAATIYEEAGQITSGEIFQALTTRSIYCFGLGDLWREWNRLDEAERLLVRGLEEVRGAISCFADEVLFGHLTLARLLQARGQSDRAIATLDAFLQEADLRRFVPQLKATAAAVRAHIELAQGNMQAALAWVQTSGLSVDDVELPYLREREYLTLARVRIAEGHENPAGSSLPDALRLLNRLLEDAQAQARVSSALEILVLQALALRAQKELQGALATLKQALALAEPEGYTRLFVDEGAPMRDLLRQALSRGIAPHYITRLLAVFGESEKGAEVSSPSPPGSLVEPLTKRECEVLHWLSEGASNREIAERLIVSTGTIKKHISNICGKLGVQSRTQAIARARTLNLL